MGGKRHKRKRERPRKGKLQDAPDKRVKEGLKERAAEIGAPPTGDMPAAGGAEWGGWGGLPPA